MTRPHRHRDPPNSLSLSHKWLDELFVPTDQPGYNSNYLGLSNPAKASLPLPGLWTSSAWTSIGPFSTGPSRALADLRETHSLSTGYYDVITATFHPALHVCFLFLALFTSPYKRKDVFCLTMEIQISWLEHSPYCNSPFWNNPFE